MRVLVVDDHATFRLGVARLVEKLQPSALLLEAGTGADALAVLDRHPDVSIVLLDLDLPDHSGFDVMAMIRAKVPRAAVVVLSAYDQAPLVRQALKLGAMSFISKKYPIDKFEKVLSQVFNGQPHVVSSIANSTLQPLDGRDSLFFPVQLKPLLSENPLTERRELTEREKQVLRFLIQGWSNNDIGEALDMKEGTTKTHVASIYRKLRVTNRTELIMTVEQLGLIL
jgi:DNA-binding NarL/FixJ family response regulator